MRKTMAATAAIAVSLTGASVAAHADERGPVRGPRPISVELSVLGTYHTDAFDESAAEIVAHDPDTQRLFVVNAAAATVEVLDVSDPEEPTKLFDLETAGVAAADGSTVAEGGVANSVAVHDGVIVVAVEAEDRTEPGWVVFFGADGVPLNALRVGALPDMATFTPHGRALLVANEGEPSDDYTADPEGSVSVVRMSGDPRGLTQDDVDTADFRAWDEGRELHSGVRVFGPDLSTEEPGTPGRVARNLEPEYISAGARGTAYVVLQEANAFAVLDVGAAEFTDIVPFGVKDHLESGNGLDASNRDGEARIENWPVYGMYQPDGFDTYRWRGRTLLVTANEGDSRDWDGYSEEERLGSLAADTPLCEDSPRLRDFLADNDQGIGTVDELLDDANLGRLHVSAEDGLREDGSCYEDVYAHGGRSFSIWTADGERLFDSGADFERITAEADPDHFNANNDESSFDARSDDKGPEPESAVVGRVSGRTYAFVGLERVGGVMVYDITDPRSAFFVRYLNNRDFSAEPGTREAGDLGPEGLTFIEADDSPIPGVPVLAVANEVSGSTSLFRVDRVVPGRR
ncbi:choice-of-anchor I family protein [Nocardiopsis sp. EMB25]|uniref:choice-of-anchor I family protein n=1 Tax=Nocardiopsis sp. EMB25 TaxID=2835867 RepID=UPI002283DD5F|nr:choice-of-anchor I family protein [Nocardiopsis sp. EMB25]MCY9786748.1 choice-of-anchor I family protein [Nocardiopsis sp. EMB25]